MDASLPAKPKQSGVERRGFEQTVLLLQGGGALGSNIVHLIYNAAKSPSPSAWNCRRAAWRKDCRCFHFLGVGMVVGAILGAAFCNRLAAATAAVGGEISPRLRTCPPAPSPKPRESANRWCRRSVRPGEATDKAVRTTALRSWTSALKNGSAGPAAGDRAPRRQAVRQAPAALRGDSCKPAPSCAAPPTRGRGVGPAWSRRSDIDRGGSAVTGCNPGRP